LVGYPRAVHVPIDGSSFGKSTRGLSQGPRRVRKRSQKIKSIPVVRRVTNMDVIEDIRRTPITHNSVSETAGCDVVDNNRQQ